MSTITLTLCVIDVEIFVYVDDIALRANNREDPRKALCLLTNMAPPM